MKPVDQGLVLKEQQRVATAHLQQPCCAPGKLTLFTAGTTFTMAVLYGNLLTVANVGDSKAFMDTGSEIVELSTSHRIEDNIGNLIMFSLDCRSFPRGFRAALYSAFAMQCQI